MIDRLHLGRVILIGHSIAGEEMTRFAGTYPDRVAKLVYLDGAYDRLAADSMFNEIFPVLPDVPPRPQPTAADTATPAAYVAFVRRTRGVDIPEADIRTRYRYDGWEEEYGIGYQSMRSNILGIRPSARRRSRSTVIRHSLPARAVAARGCPASPASRGSSAERNSSSEASIVS